MKVSLIRFLGLVLILASFNSMGGEKGGNGIFGREEAILHEYRLTKLCPMEPKKNLCAKIEDKLKDPLWDIKQKSVSEQNEEDFFFDCCLNSYSESENPSSN